MDRPLTIAIAGAHVWSLEAFNRTEHLDPLRDRNDFDRDGRHG